MSTTLTTTADSLSLTLFHAARALQMRLASRLSEHLARVHGMELSSGQLSFLGALICGDNSPSDIARRLGVSRQAAQKQARDMARDGLLTIRSDPSRRNRTVITFTERGTALMMACRALLAELDAELGPDAASLAAAVPLLDRAFTEADGQWPRPTS